MMLLVLLLLIIIMLQYDLYLHCRGLLWNQVSSHTVQSHGGMDHCCAHTGGMPGYSDGHKIQGSKLKTERCYCSFPLFICTQDKLSTVALDLLICLHESRRLLTEHLRILTLCQHYTETHRFILEGFKRNSLIYMGYNLKNKTIPSVIWKYYPKEFT